MAVIYVVVAEEFYGTWKRDVQYNIIIYYYIIIFDRRSRRPRDPVIRNIILDNK